MDQSSRARRKAERPGEILDAAFSEFVAKGFAATRLEDVAARIGVTKGTIYFYFANKEQLFAAMVRQLFVPLHDRIMEFTSDPTRPAPDVLRDFLAFIHECVARDEHAREIMRLLIAEAPRFPDLVDEHYETCILPMAQQLRTCLAAGVARQGIRATSLEAFPEILLGPALAMNIWMLLFSDRRPIDPDRHFDATIDLILYGLLPRDRPESATR